MAQWQAQVTPGLHKVSADLTNVGDDLNAPTMGGACSSLTTDAQALQTEPPAPVASVNTPFQAAMTDLAVAGSDCRAAAANGWDADQISAFEGAFTTGDSDLTQAVAALQQALNDGD